MITSVITRIIPEELVKVEIYYSRNKDKSSHYFTFIIREIMLSSSCEAFIKYNYQQKISLGGGRNDKIGKNKISGPFSMQS